MLSLKSESNKDTRGNKCSLKRHRIDFVMQICRHLGRKQMDTDIRQEREHNIKAELHLHPSNQRRRGQKSARIVPTWRNNMMECPARLFAAPTCPVRQSDTLSTWTEFGIIENLGRRQECLSEQILAIRPRTSFPRAKLTRAHACAAQNFYLFLR